MKYSIGQIVKIKATGEKVRIVIVEINGDTWLKFKDGTIAKIHPKYFTKFCPSRTGTRDPKTGRFVSNGHRPTHNMEIVGNWNVCNDCFFRERIDSKQRNYQKILTKLDVLEKKIDKLNHETTYR